ncbi:MAG: type VI secretion system baseplate subunit TssG [Pseudomonadota bacterium]
MASDEREEGAHLSRLDMLAADPARHNILMALRIIDASFPGRPRLGASARPAEDPVRLGQIPQMAFPVSTIADYVPAKPAEGTKPPRPPKLRQLFFGMWGPNGALPLHLTEYARERVMRHNDPTLVEFCDVFHHRLLSLYYQAWLRSEAAPSFDRTDADPFGDKVAAVAGIYGDHLSDRDSTPDGVKRYYAGLMAMGPRNGAGLLAMLRSFFTAPVAIQDFIGSWLQIEPEERWRLGEGRLGEDTTVGAKVWSRQSKIRIRIGPLSLSAYRRLLPGGASLRRLTAIVRAYLGDAMDWDVNLVLRHDQVPQTVLGIQGALGLTTWLGDTTPGRDADDLALRPAAALGGPAIPAALPSVLRKARP